MKVTAEALPGAYQGTLVRIECDGERKTYRVRNSKAERIDDEAQLYRKLSAMFVRTAECYKRKCQGKESALNHAKDMLQKAKEAEKKGA